MAESLTEFLTARLNEDEVYARTVGRVGEELAGEFDPASLAAVGDAALVFLAHPEIVVLMRTWGGRKFPPNSFPRILAEVEAKRRIVPLLVSCSELGGGYDDGAEPGKAALRLLALPYADHPDYRKEWRP